MRILELFAGYGSQALALENLGIEFTSNISEIDKYAIQAYNQLHGDTHNWGDITKIDETKLPYYDLITYSSPCQDFSVAGLQRGGDKDSGTRSSLLWECERIIRAVKPKYLLMENVKNLVGQKHKHNFIKWLKVLESIGYKNWWKVLNAKDYGVPQNRERVFVVSILGGTEYLFPNPIKLEKRLKDILEPVVDEKYYLSNKLIEGFMRRIDRQDSGFAREINIRDKDNIASTLTARMAKCGITDNYIQEPVVCASRGRNPENPNDRTAGAPNEQRLEVNQTGCSNTITTVAKDNYVVEPSVKQVGNIMETDSFGGNPQCGRVYSDSGLSPTLNTMQGGGREPKIIEDFYKGRNPREYENESPTIRSERTGLKVDTGYRIRKLTPRECWRLMGVKDEQYDKLHDISNTQLYKMAGNSIVVDVLMGIFKNLLVSDEGTKGQLTLL
jgi:DNA (cytosine-5)-methyltransferase 1